MWKSFVCASTAALMLKMFDPFRTGETALYHVKYDTDWHAFETASFIIMGIIGVSLTLYTGLSRSHTLKVMARAYMEASSSNST